MSNASAILAPHPDFSVAIDRQKLAKAVDLVMPAIDGSVIPILNTVLIAAENRAVSVRGTNLDMEITVSISESDMRGEFNMALPAKKFRKILKDAPECADVHASQRGNSASINFGKANYNLSGLDVSDFPQITAYESRKSNFTIRSSDLRDYLTRVSPAISTEETRYYLNGVFLHEYDGKACIVATDGHRCHVQAFEAPSGMMPMVERPDGNYPGIIIPREAVKILHDVLKGKKVSEGVQIEAQGERITFNLDVAGLDYSLTTKTIDGTFPDYRRIMPVRNSKVAVFDTSDLQTAIKAVTVIRDTGKGMIVFQVNKDGSSISCRSEDGSSSFPIPSRWNGEEEFIIGFNSVYLKEMLAISGSSFQANWDDAGAPGLFTSPGMEDFSMTVMPMRV